VLGQCREAAFCVEGESSFGNGQKTISEIGHTGFSDYLQRIRQASLEYAIQAWSPYVWRDSDCLEKIQRATKMMKDFQKLPQEFRLKKLKVSTLEKMQL